MASNDEVQRLLTSARELCGEQGRLRGELEANYNEAFARATRENWAGILLHVNLCGESLLVSFNFAYHRARRLHDALFLLLAFRTPILVPRGLFSLASKQLPV